MCTIHVEADAMTATSPTETPPARDLMTDRPILPQVRKRIQELIIFHTEMIMDHEEAIASLSRALNRPSESQEESR